MSKRNQIIVSHWQFVIEQYVRKYFRFWRANIPAMRRALTFILVEHWDGLHLLMINDLPRCVAAAQSEEGREHRGTPNDAIEEARYGVEVGWMQGCKVCEGATLTGRPHWSISSSLYGAAVVAKVVGGTKRRQRAHRRVL